MYTRSVLPLQPILALESLIFGFADFPLEILLMLLSSPNLRRIAWTMDGGWDHPELELECCLKEIRTAETLGFPWKCWENFLDDEIDLADGAAWSMTTLVLKPSKDPSESSEDVFDFFEGRGLLVLPRDSHLRRVVLVHEGHTASFVPPGHIVNEIMDVSQAMTDTILAAPALECVSYVTSDRDDAMSGWRQAFGIEPDFGELEWIVREYCRSTSSGDTLLHVRYCGYRRWPNLPRIAPDSCAAFRYLDGTEEEYKRTHGDVSTEWGHKAVMAAEIGWTEFLDFRGRPVIREVMDAAFALADVDWRQTEGGRNLNLPEESWRLLEEWYESQFGRDATMRAEHGKAWEKMSPEDRSDWKAKLRRRNEAREAKARRDALEAGGRKKKKRRTRRKRKKAITS